jgi:type IV pilus biogenesis protein CpaD/CtpE
MTRIALRLVVLSIVSLAAAGCTITDPYERAGVWHPRGSNNGNLAVMVADPNDLVIGRGVSTSNGWLASRAIDRLYSDTVKPLPDSSLVIAPINSGSNGSAGGGSGGGDSGGSGASGGAGSGSGVQ